LILDYRLADRSRKAAIVGRRKVLTGKAKFGIFGDGNELPQLAIAHAFQKGNWRSDYYRDQTWMFALNLLKGEQVFAQLYAHDDPAFELNTGGRNLNGLFYNRRSLVCENQGMQEVSVIAFCSLTWGARGRRFKPSSGRCAALIKALCIPLPRQE